MAKDPAILFYTSDFLTGTFTMTDEQVGRYIKLLCLQHQKGFLTDIDLRYICRGEDQVVFSKFQKQPDGTFINQTLLQHTEKRKKYSESRRNNRKPKKETTHDEHMIDISKTYVPHMENENENVIVNDNIIRIGNEIFKKRPSDILRNEYRNLLNGMLMGKLRGVDENELLDLFDEEYPNYSFRDSNHFINSLKYIWERRTIKPKLSAHEQRQQNAASVDNLEKLALRILQEPTSDQYTGGDSEQHSDSPKLESGNW